MTDTTSESALPEPRGYEAVNQVLNGKCSIASTESILLYLRSLYSVIAHARLTESKNNLFCLRSEQFYTV